MKFQTGFSVSKGFWVLDEQNCDFVFLKMRLGPGDLPLGSIGFGWVALLAGMLQTASEEQR